MLSIFTCFKFDDKVASLVYEDVTFGDKYVYMCITRNKNVCIIRVGVREVNLYIYYVCYIIRKYFDFVLVCLSYNDITVF